MDNDFTVLALRGLCGRPTRRGMPCQSSRALAGWSAAPACGPHLTAVEREEVKRAKQSWEEYLASAAVPRLTVPACWAWPVTDADRRRAVETEWIGEWQAGRCACCGLAGGSDVVDHDHETGWIRGLLCRSCNGKEPGSTHHLFRRYRRHFPAKILGVWTRYSHPFYGLDRGQLHGLPTVRALRVNSDGEIAHPGPLTGRDPSVLVSAALAKRS